MPLNKLNEICKASALKATSALSRFLETPLGIDVTPVEVNKFKNMHLVKDTNEKTINMFMPITGNLSGASLFNYSKKSALSLCDVLLHRVAGSTKEIKEMEISALSEVTNILIGNFLTLFSHSLQLDSVMHRSAIFKYAPFNKAVSDELSRLSGDKDQSLIKMSFSFEHSDIKGVVFIILDEGTLLDVLNNMKTGQKM